MSFPDITLLQGAVHLSVSIMGVGIFLALFRLARGPSLPDRMMAVDLIALMTLGILVAYSMGRETRVLLDVATVLALVAFLGTVSFAHYVEQRGCDE